MLGDSWVGVVYRVLQTPDFKTPYRHRYYSRDDSFGFEEVQTDATTCASEKLLPTRIIHQLKQKVPEELKTTTWTSLTQQTMSTTACELALLQDAVKTKRVSQLSGTWRSSFLLKETLNPKP